VFTSQAFYIMEYNHHTQRREMHALALAALNKTCTFYIKSAAAAVLANFHIFTAISVGLCAIRWLISIQLLITRNMLLLFTLTLNCVHSFAAYSEYTRYE